MRKFRKFKKFHRLSYNNIEFFKDFDSIIMGLKTNQNCRLTFKHLDSLVKLVKFFVRKKKCKINFWLGVVPLHNVTLKSKGLRMGRGKGAVSHKVCYVAKGTFVMLVLSWNYIVVKRLLRACLFKLPSTCGICFFNGW